MNSRAFMVIENAEAEPTTSAARAMDNFAIVKVWCRGDVNDVYYSFLPTIALGR